MSIGKLLQALPPCLLAFALAGQTVFDDWRIRQPNPPANALRAAIHAEGRFVAVGYHATVVTSATGAVWETRFLHPGFDAQGVVYAEGTYVMVDRDGYVATSEDLDAWHLQLIGASSLEDVIYADGQFVTVGRVSRVFSSDDGVDWTRHTAAEESRHLMAIAYGNGYYMAIARGGVILRSSNLEDWSEVFAGFPGTENQTNNWEGMVFSNGKFIAYGPYERLLVSSDDGANWTDLPLEFDSRFTSHTEWEGELWLAGSSDAIIHSADGINWQHYATGIDVSIGAIAASSERILALDDNSTVLASDDGENWSALLENELPDYSSIAYQDGHYVALASGDRIFHSTDGVNWTEVLDVSATTINYTGLGYVGDRFVAVGGRGTIAWSTDGQNWDTDTTVDFSAIVREVSVANGMLFAGCDGGIVASSPDGLNWTEHDTGAGAGYGFRIEQVSYANGAYFAAGGSGTLARSTDLQDWTLIPLNGTTAVMEKLVYFNNQYILFHVSGSRLLFSDDLSTWADDRTDPIVRAGGAWIFDGRIVVAGNTGTIYTSEDGDTFVEHALPASTFREIVYDGTQYVAVGPAGVIATTGTEPLSVLNLSITGNGTVARSPDQALYAPSTVVRLTAQAPAGQQFLWWDTTDGRVLSSSLDLALEADTNVTAVFAGEQPPTMSLQASAEGAALEWSADPAWVLHQSSDLSDWAPTTGVEREDDTARLPNLETIDDGQFFQFKLQAQ